MLCIVDDAIVSLVATYNFYNSNIRQPLCYSYTHCDICHNSRKMLGLVMNAERIDQ